ncbi:WD40-repeat-containing domain protein [Dichotomocladium elegans]|nr:WD40-repeat-containing domain protein [Dichotomocladium elegans]
MTYIRHSNNPSPPATPPSLIHSHNRKEDSSDDDKLPRRDSNPILQSDNDELLTYILSVRDTFSQLNQKQQRQLLSELLKCCDNQLLTFLYSLISPKLKIDFITQLPNEVALQVLGFIDGSDVYTLAQISRVSKRWNALLCDESIWKEMCRKYMFKSRRRSLPASPIGNAAISSYRGYYRRLFTIENAWERGTGKIISCTNAIQSSLVTCLQMEGPYIVVGCDNRRIEVFDSRTGKHIKQLVGQSGGVWALEFVVLSDKKAVLVSGGCDRDLRVWDLPSGDLRHVLRGHSSTIRCLKMQSDARIVVTGSRDASIRIWDIKQGVQRHVCLGHQSSVRCLDIHGHRVASGSYDHTARLWDVNTGKCLHIFVGHLSQIYAIVFDGVRVITGSLDSTIRVWSADTGVCLATLQGHTSLVGHLQLSPTDPSILVSGGSDGCLRVWNLDVYECRHRISAHDNSITCIHVDNGRILTGGSDGRVKLWNLETGTLVRAFTQPARTVWKVQFTATKAVVILQRPRVPPMQQILTAIELHRFDLD